MNTKKCNQCIDFIGTYKYCPMCGLYIGENDYHKTQEPIITNEGGGDNKQKETHPAYAQLSFSRINSSKNDNNTLYGSAIRHQTIISMKVYKSEKYYSNYTENYFGYGVPYIEVEMSQAQFSEAITSMNIGSGVPVTLRSIRGEVIPHCTELTIQEKTQRDLTNVLKTFANSLVSYKQTINSILDKKGPLTQTEKTNIKGVYSQLFTEISSNIPFLNECMQEALDKNTAAAKADVEAFFLHAITKLGMDAIQNNTDVLNELTQDMDLRLISNNDNER